MKNVFKKLEKQGFEISFIVNQEQEVMQDYVIDNEGIIDHLDNKVNYLVFNENHNDFYIMKVSVSKKGYYKYVDKVYLELDLFYSIDNKYVDSKSGFEMLNTNELKELFDLQKQKEEIYIMLEKQEEEKIGYIDKIIKYNIDNFDFIKNNTITEL